MLNVSDIVISEVGLCLAEHGYTKLSDEQTEVLKDQILHITDADNSVQTLISKYLEIFFICDI